MGTTADKLARLNETKALLKTRLTEKGLDVASEDNFYNLANKVGEIKGSETATIRFIENIGIENFDVYFYKSDGTFHEGSVSDWSVYTVPIPCVILFSSYSTMSLVNPIGDANEVFSHQGMNVGIYYYSINGDSDFELATQ